MPWKSWNHRNGLLFFLLDEFAYFRVECCSMISSRNQNTFTRNIWRFHVNRLKHEDNYQVQRWLFTSVIFHRKGRKFINMTIYRQESSRNAKRNLRSAKLPSLTRKRNSPKHLPPIYEIDEDCEETVSDVRPKQNISSGILGILPHHSEDKSFQVNINVPEEEYWGLSNMQRQQQKHRENTENTSTYFKRNLKRNLSVTSRDKGNNQMAFPDFFPPGMHVHCAQNSLPEASKGLYMKIMQGEAKMQKNMSSTSETSSSASSYKQYNWMQFFG